MPGARRKKESERIYLNFIDRKKANQVIAKVYLFEIAKNEHKFRDTKASLEPNVTTVSRLLLAC